MAHSKDVQEEFTLAFDLYSDDIFRHCAFRLRDRERAKEITQDTFLRYWQCLERGDKIENGRAFLYKIANNLIIDHVRRRKEISLDQLQEAGFEPGEDHLSTIQDRMDGKQALKILGKLESNYQEVLTLRYVQGLDVTEIAEVLGQKPNTVSVHIHRGLEQLRKFLDVENG